MASSSMSDAAAASSLDTPAAALQAAAHEGGGADESKDAGLAGGKRVELKKWSAVSLWSWDIEVDNCAICRNLIMEYCIECQANRGGSQSGGAGASDECTVAWGVCNHAFHFHCITRWLRTRPSCPLDNEDWEFQKYSSGHAPA